MSRLRNFYLDGSIDGRASKVSGGPSSKEGGLELSVLQRNKGAKEESVKILCYADVDGNLVTDVYHKGECVFSRKTER